MSVCLPIPSTDERRPRLSYSYTPSPDNVDLDNRFSDNFGAALIGVHGKLFYTVFLTYLLYRINVFTGKKTSKMLNCVCAVVLRGFV
jgi:hypothetical protein